MEEEEEAAVMVSFIKLLEMFAIEKYGMLDLVFTFTSIFTVCEAVYGKKFLLVKRYLNILNVQYFKYTKCILIYATRIVKW